MVEAVAPLRNGGGIAGVSSGTWDEASMQQSLVFSDTIQDLKTLRSQLYSAAEYFELAYTTGDEKQTVVSNLKEYAVKALVNTVDHLGSISFNVASLVDQRFDDVADADHRVSCIQQRTQTSQACMDREGLSQQSLVITAPKYHKRYILPAGGGDSMPNAVPNFREMSRIKNKAGEMQQVHAARPKAREKQPSFSKLRSMARAPSQRARSSSPAQHLRPPAPTETVISIIGDIKKSDSPVSSTNPLARSGSLSRKASLLKTSSVRVQSSSEPKKSASLRLHAERSDETQEGQQTPKKGRKFLKSLLSRRKSRKDEPLSGYLDEY